MIEIKELSKSEKAIIMSLPANRGINRILSKLRIIVNILKENPTVCYCHIDSLLTLQDADVNDLVDELCSREEAYIKLDMSNGAEYSGFPFNGSEPLKGPCKLIVVRE